MNEPIRINLRMASNTIAYLEYMQNTNAVDIRAKIEDYNLTGCTAQFYVKKPSGNVIYNSAEIDGDVVVIHPTMQMFSESGKQFGIVQIMARNKVGASYPIAIEVKTNFIDDSAAESSNEFTALQTALQTVNKYDNRIMAVEKGLSDETRSIQRQIHTNLLNPTAPTQTINGVTFTNNGDGTYTVNGTANGAAVLNLAELRDISIFENTKLVGRPVGGGGFVFRLFATCYNGSTSVKDYIDDGNGVILSNIPSETTTIRFRIILFNGTTANNLLFKPMLTTDLSATYDDFVPYTGDSGRLNEDVANLFDMFHPIGSLYPTTNASFNPNTANGWRGTWERIKDCVIYAAGDSDTVGSIVGSNTHTLTTSELPSHTHSIPALSGTAASAGEHTHKSEWPQWDTNGFNAGSVSAFTYSGGTAISGSTSSSGAHTHTITTNASTTGASGSGVAIDMRTCRLNSIVWRRVS